MAKTTAERTAAYRERNREKTNEYARQYYHRIKAEVFDLLGRICAQCGYADERALEVDHIEPVGHPNGARQWYREMKNVRANPHEYQILCSNCHTIKSKGEF